MANSPGKKAFLPILFTVFIDMLGVGIVAPVLPALFFNPSQPMLPVGLSYEEKSILFGLLIASFPFAQFFGAPVLGALSDRYGRKKLLLISLAGTFVGYLLFALSIMIGSLPLLFFSRALDGFTGGNIAIAFSTISDLSDEKSKAANFGMVGAAFGIGFILGPYLGGVLADPGVYHAFNESTPFWFAGLITGINIILLLLNFKETLKEPHHTPINWLTGFRNIARAFSMNHLRILFTISFLYTLGFTFFTQFFSVYLFERFGFSVSEVGNTFAYVGLWIVIAQAAIQRKLSKKITPLPILKITLLIVSMGIPALLLAKAGMHLLFIIPIVALSNGISTPNMLALVSSRAKPDEQGSIMGINQSVSSLAMCIPPVIAAYIHTLDIRLPMLTAGAMIFFGWLILLTIFPKTPAGR